jgi:hypothetical protein
MSALGGIGATDADAEAETLALGVVEALAVGVVVIGAALFPPHALRRITA